MTESWLAPKSPDLVWFSGKDAVRFLNDLISREISSMTPGEVRRSLLLGPDGKLDHLLWVLKFDDRIGLVTDPGRGGELANTLGRYRIRVDVEIVPEPEPVWLVMGPYDGVDVSWGRRKRVLVVGARPDLPVGTESEYDRERIAAGEPEWGVDIDEKTIPQETGLVGATVDFDKGCYLGQELVARIDSRGGNVPRHLRMVTLSAPVDPGSPVFHGERQVGVLSSVSETSGLGMIRREVLPGEEVRVDGVGGTVGEIPQKAKT